MNFSVYNAPFGHSDWEGKIIRRLYAVWYRSLRKTRAPKETPRLLIQDRFVDTCRRADTHRPAFSRAAMAARAARNFACLRAFPDRLRKMKRGSYEDPRPDHLLIIIPASRFAIG